MADALRDLGEYFVRRAKDVAFTLTKARWFTAPADLKRDFVGKPVEMFQQGYYTSADRKRRYPQMRVSPKSHFMTALKARVSARDDINNVRILVSPQDIGTFNHVPGRLNISVAEQQGEWKIIGLCIG
ncbi:MAG: hypothetical protein GC136_07780 [Alphaproteobacteria bacterium]|nr:hypothetical protein [Alphaproteobacteria bacterium]